MPLCPFFSWLHAERTRARAELKGNSYIYVWTRHVFIILCSLVFKKKLFIKCVLRSVCLFPRARKPMLIRTNVDIVQLHCAMTRYCLFVNLLMIIKWKPSERQRVEQNWREKKICVHIVPSIYYIVWWAIVELGI